MSSSEQNRADHVRRVGDAARSDVGHILGMLEGDLADSFPDEIGHLKALLRSLEAKAL